MTLKFRLLHCKSKTPNFYKKNNPKTQKLDYLELVEYEVKR